MQRFFEDLYQQLAELHDNMKQNIEGLTTEALDWVPGPDMNSLAVLVTHTAEAERYWIGEMVGGDDANRTRSDEFVTGNRTAEDLAAQLDATLAHSKGVLESLTLDDLGKTHHHEQRGEVGISWSLLHTLEHTGQHTGHVQLTRQLWDQRG